MDVSVDDLKEIVRICVASELQAVYLEVGPVKLALSRSDAPLPLPGPAPVAAPGGGPAAAAPDPAAASANAAPPSANAAPASEAATEAVAAGPAVEPSAAELFEVRAPLLGVFYRRPAPGEPPFAEVGTEVGEEDTVCLIEVMKMFSRVPAGCRGRVAEICVEDGTMVEYGQTLMRIRTA